MTTISPEHNLSTWNQHKKYAHVMVSEPLVSNDVLRIIQWVVYAITCQLVDILGTGANVINIVCFVKQGFKDPVNVTLLGLAISDLGCLATLIFTCLCYCPSFQDLDLPFEPVEMQYLTTGWPHVIFARVTSWLTAFIAFERCICITMPLKVKTLFTPTRVTVVIVFTFVVLICSVSPIYYANGYDWKFSHLRNRTVVGLVFSPDREAVERISFPINNVFVPFCAFIIVIVCTTTSVINLNSKRKWRKTALVSEQGQGSSNRDQKVTKMVIVISTMFIASFSPVCLLFVAMLFVPGLAVDGNNINTLIAVSSFMALLESVNSSMNIFIYYYMSSRYRAIFQQLFHMK